jgi:hypothetical protein
MPSWGCPHEVDNLCSRVAGRACDPGMKGCVLAGRFRFSNEDKNRPPRKRPQAESDDPLPPTG